MCIEKKHTFSSLVDAKIKKKLSRHLLKSWKSLFKTFTIGYYAREERSGSTPHTAKMSGDL